MAFSLFIIRGVRAVFHHPRTHWGPDQSHRYRGRSIHDPADPPDKARGILSDVDEHAVLFSRCRPIWWPKTGNGWLDAIGEYSTGWQTPDNLVTSGPYLPVSNQFHVTYVVLHRNPLWPLERPGNVDVVNITFLDEQDAFEMWQERLLDIAPLPPDESEAFATLRNQGQDDTGSGLVLPRIQLRQRVFREAEVSARSAPPSIDKSCSTRLYDLPRFAMRHASVPGMVAAIPFEELGGNSPGLCPATDGRQFVSLLPALLPEITFLVSSADLSLLQAEIIRNMWVEELECKRKYPHPTGAVWRIAGRNATGCHRPAGFVGAGLGTHLPDAKNLITDLLHCDESEPPESALFRGRFAAGSGRDSG